MRADDVLRELEPHEIQEWIAAWKIGLDPDSWYQMATICQAIQNEHQQDRIQQGGLKRSQIREEMFAKADDYLPKEMRNGKNR